MAWITSWWDGLQLFGQILACVAIPATVLMVIQTIGLLVSGLGHDDVDMPSDTSGIGDMHGTGAIGDGTADWETDLDGDFSVDHDHDLSHGGDGLRLFTVRGIIAFFAVGGWAGLAVWQSNGGAGLAVTIATIVGLAALLFAAWIMKAAMKLQEDGTMRLSNAIAHMATVYIPIPPQRRSTGRVTLNLQERFTELDAITDSETPLATGQHVMVTAVVGGNTLLVKAV